MRIRIANGVGFVRLVVALVIVLVVMSGSAAFGQQSGRVAKSKKATVQGVSVQATSKKGSDMSTPQVPKEADVRIQTDPPGYQTGPVYVDGERPGSSAPPYVTAAPDYGGGSSGSAPRPNSGDTQAPEGTGGVPSERIQHASCRCLWTEYFNSGWYPPPAPCDNEARQQVDHDASYNSFLNISPASLPDRSHADVCQNGGLSNFVEIQYWTSWNLDLCGDTKRYTIVVFAPAKRCVNPF